MKPKPINIDFRVYGKAFDTISFTEILIEQHNGGMLYARAEDSGNEAMFCEVARWSDERNRWEVAYHAKVWGFGEEIGEEYVQLNDEETAHLLASTINDLGFDWRISGGRDTMAIISRMPSAADPVLG